jgi:hypothetical protein
MNRARLPVGGQFVQGSQRGLRQAGTSRVAAPSLDDDVTHTSTACISPDRGQRPDALTATIPKATASLLPRIGIRPAWRVKRWNSICFYGGGTLRTLQCRRHLIIELGGEVRAHGQRRDRPTDHGDRHDEGDGTEYDPPRQGAQVPSSGTSPWWVDHWRPPATCRVESERVTVMSSVSLSRAQRRRSISRAKSGHGRPPLSRATERSVADSQRHSGIRCCVSITRQQDRRRGGHRAPATGLGTGHSEGVAHVDDDVVSAWS